ncbi:hypothetical protein [Pseudomonas mangiferae]|uniref:DUF1795 domain-containing protein n=1 Tax=Pseudomonas mangiferae TaxID=2593654 RepID=A0A553H4D0_9PSED|nr:hypothetical protein [Pseudomonas mangiferae]TRX76601.1 hypothetical protein FM069_00840 [Pseudomonas mangiferae]
MRLRHPALLAALALCCTQVWANEPAACTFRAPSPADTDYINLGSLNVIPVPTVALSGARVATFGRDLTVKLSDGKTLDFQVETSKTLQVSGLQVNELPGLIASGDYPKDLSAEHRTFIDEMRHSLETIVTTERPCRLVSTDGKRSAYIYHADDNGKETWLLQMVTDGRSDSYTGLVARDFSKEQFERIVLQGAFLK